MHNEGETDPLGSFMAGTKPARGESMEGKEEEVLWRVRGGKEGEKVERLIERMGLPNGMGFSNDGKTLYHSSLFHLSFSKREFHSPSSLVT